MILGLNFILYRRPKSRRPGMLSAKKQSSTAQIINRLNTDNALDYTIVVAANAADPAALQYLAPYAGVSIAEYFMQKGRDVLVVYDDLTKHAWAYQQISLVLRRPAGREIGRAHV